MHARAEYTAEREVYPVVNDLVDYTRDSGAFPSSANPNLPKSTVADLVETHVLTLKDVMDAQAKGATACGPPRRSAPPPVT